MYLSFEYIFLKGVSLENIDLDYIRHTFHLKAERQDNGLPVIHLQWKIILSTSVLFTLLSCFSLG